VTKDVAVIKAVSVPKQRSKKHSRFAPVIGGKWRLLIDADHVRLPLQWVCNVVAVDEVQSGNIPVSPLLDRHHSPDKRAANKP